ncbi:PilN domain-containing protein [Aeribacillus pallidus]|uniref:PilN domain-containing protein n=1 Tax=Aeribacillus pallidus TaxID=33936 RepID=UPI003D1D7C86
MIIDINLLPRKEDRHRAPKYILIFIIALTLITGGIYWFQLHIVFQKIETLEQMVNQTRQIRETEEQKSLSYTSNKAYQQLEQAVTWASQYPIQAVPIMKELISILPERGFFRHFKWMEQQTIELSIQFDSQRDAAYYFTSLTKIEWISDVQLRSIKTEPVVADDAENNENEDVLPRYIALYEIKLNKQLVKEHFEQEGGSS